MDRGEGPEDFAEQVVDVDGVGRQAAAELAREGAAPAGGGVVGGRAPPVGLGGGDRRRRGEAFGAEVVELLDAVAEAVLEDRRDATAGGALGGGEGVELGEAAGDGLLDDDVEAGGDGGDALRRVQVWGRADVDEVAGEEVVEGGVDGGDAVPGGDLRRAGRLRS